MTDNEKKLIEQIEKLIAAAEGDCLGYSELEEARKVVFYIKQESNG